MTSLTRSATIATTLSLLLLTPASAMAVGTTSDSDTSQVTAGVGAEISITATDPGTMTLSHFATASNSAGAVDVVSTQPWWTISVRDLDATTPGKLDRTSGTGPSSLNDSFRIAGGDIAAPTAITGSNQNLYSSSANDAASVTYDQSLASGEDVIAGDNYASTVQYSVVANDGPDVSTFTLVLADGYNLNSGGIFTADAAGSNRNQIFTQTSAMTNALGGSSPNARYTLGMDASSRKLTLLNNDRARVKLAWSEVCPAGQTLDVKQGFNADSSEAYFNCIAGATVNYKKMDLNGNISSDTNGSTCSGVSLGSRWADSKFAFTNSAAAAGDPVIKIGSSPAQSSNSCNPSGTTLATKAASQSVTSLVQYGGQFRSATFVPAYGGARISPDGSKVVWTSNQDSAKYTSCVFVGTWACAAVAAADLYVRPADASSAATRYAVQSSSQLTAGQWSANGAALYTVISSTDGNGQYKRVQLSNGAITSLNLASNKSGKIYIIGAKN